MTVTRSSAAALNGVTEEMLTQARAIRKLFPAVRVGAFGDDGQTTAIRRVLVAARYNVVGIPTRKETAL